MTTVFHSLRSRKLVDLLKKGAVGVIPSDTIYGISCSALNPDAVERIYNISGRDRKKPFIILIHSLSDLALFGVRLPHEEKCTLIRIWPAPVSIVLPCLNKHFVYLHRSRKSLAFRMPAWKPLRVLLKKTGPLVTTSVNPEGKKPAISIGQAKRYFGDALDFYVDLGFRKGTPSTLLKPRKDGFTILRQGSYRL